MDEESERAALEEIIRSAKGYVAQEARMPATDISDPRTEAVFWKDSAMSLPPVPGERIEHKLRPGYVVIFDTPRGKYRFHADITTRIVRYDSRSQKGY